MLRTPPPLAEEDQEKVKKENGSCKESAKIRTLMKLLDKCLESPDKRIIVFSQWTSMLDLVEPFLTRQGIKFVRFDGAMSMKDRDDAINQFQRKSPSRVFLMSLKAGSLGLNLTAASEVIMIDPWYNPAVEQQAIDRVYRIGQTQEVNIYRLITNDSIEERVLELQETKKELYDKAFTEQRNIRDVRLENLRVLLGIRKKSRRRYY